MSAALPAWRAAGVTHWHLVRRDWNRADPDRFDHERWCADAARPSHGIARSPAEVADWLITEALRAVADSPQRAEMLAHSVLADDAGRALCHENRLFAAMHGRDVASMIGLSSARIADLTAYAQTEHTCTAHRIDSRPPEHP